MWFVDSTCSNHLSRNVKAFTKIMRHSKVTLESEMSRSFNSREEKIFFFKPTNKWNESQVSFMFLTLQFLQCLTTTFERLWINFKEDLCKIMDKWCYLGKIRMTKSKIFSLSSKVTLIRVFILLFKTIFGHLMIALSI